MSEQTQKESKTPKKRPKTKNKPDNDGWVYIGNNAWMKRN